MNMNMKLSLARVKLVRELGILRVEIPNTVGVKRIPKLRRLAEIRAILMGEKPMPEAIEVSAQTQSAGFEKSVENALPKTAVSPKEKKKAKAEEFTEETAEDIQEEKPEVIAPRVSTAHLYAEEKPKGISRAKRNAMAVDIIQRVRQNGLPKGGLTDEEKKALAGYSGCGGALMHSDGRKGSAYEYYTPKPIADGIWDALKGAGFAGGKVLDPCSGAGIFGATAPLNCVIDAVELDSDSATVNSLVNGGVGYNVTNLPFEKYASETPDGIYDAVVSNVPFGDKSARGNNWKHDERYQDEPLEGYFILRSLEKLKAGGMAAFIVPTRVVESVDMKKLRSRASMKAEFLGAYRLPSGTFSDADTDVATDVIFFKKFSEAQAEIIAGLDKNKEETANALRESKVLWDVFINGKWFVEDGKAYQLGEFQAKDPNKFRDIDRYVSNASLSDLREILRTRKLPASRIDWKLLSENGEAALPDVIAYQDGDRITQAGMTLEMQNGIWVQIKTHQESDEMCALLSSLDTPLSAFDAGVSWKKAIDCANYLYASSQWRQIPDWFRKYCDDTSRIPEKSKANIWKKGLTAMAVTYVLDKRDNEVGLDYRKEYEKLSSALERSKITRADIGKVGPFLGSALGMAYRQYSSSKGFSDLWCGNVKNPDEVSDILEQNSKTEEGRILNLRYQNQTNVFNIEDIKSIKGQDFDPVATDEWCITGNGKQVMLADDYYVGNYGDFLKKLDAEIASCTDERVKSKLLRQKAEAATRVTPPDLSGLTFTIFSPQITIEEKVRFLQMFGYPQAEVGVDARSGRAFPSIKVGKAEDYREKLVNRLNQYFNTGNLTLGGIDLPQGVSEKQALQDLREMALKVNTQFNSWVRGNDLVMARLRAKANEPANLEFDEREDGSALPIPGMNPSLSLRDYQCAFVRKMGHSFGGINGFGVGLGKTFTALSSVQYVQSIGAKKKTIFVVPNSVLSNWKKEASRAYSSIDDCLFVGLREVDGKMVSSSSYYEEDLQEILLHKHRKIFMTMECFQKIKLREDTVEKFKDFLRDNDSSYQLNGNDKHDENVKNALENYFKPYDEYKKRNQKASTPFLEDMKVDSIVIDEGHFYKNSVSAPDSEGSMTRYLAITPANGRGVDMQMKTWYVRGTTPLGDGTLLLTATPVTNSPLEMYSMMSLAVGRERLNRLASVNGADEFINTVCDIRSDEGRTIDDVAKNQSVFVGLNNVSLIRNALGKVATVKEAKDIEASVHVPERDKKVNKVVLSKQSLSIMGTYKDAYRYATEKYKCEHAEELGRKGNKESWEEVEKRIDPDGSKKRAYLQMKDLFKEPDEILGHPFNLISKMTNVILDPELRFGDTVYNIDPKDKAKADKVMKEFNKLKRSEDRAIGRPNRFTRDTSITGQRMAMVNERDEMGNKVRVKSAVADITLVEAFFHNGGKSIVLDSQEYATQQAFEAIAKKYGLELSVNGSPKLDALIENVSEEMKNPRGLMPDGKGGAQVSPIVKQIIFCDTLATHSKIKRMLVKKCGIPAGKIAIITGQTNGDPDDIMAVQEGFNAQGEENVYQIIIANKKAEVGINLQKGTQAIHHLTIGWTPDSLEQRNGRGARQGNMTDVVATYYYEADGTFDSVKRDMVSHKADWIGNVMKVDGGDKVAIAGGLTNEEIEELCEIDGDPETLARAKAKKEAEEAKKRAKNVRDKQLINLDTFLLQKKYLNDNPTAIARVKALMTQYWKVKTAYDNQEEKVQTNDDAAKKAEREGKPITDKKVIKKHENAKKLLQQLTLKKQELTTLIDTSVQFVDRGSGKACTPDQVISRNAWSKRSVEWSIGVLGGERSDFDVNIIESGTVYQDWQNNCQQARDMMAGSREEFMKLASEDGSLPADACDKIDSGEAALMKDGKYICKGDIVKTKRYKETYVGFVIEPAEVNPEAYGWIESSKELLGSFTAVDNIEIVSRGTDEWEELCQIAAGIEDKLAQGNIYEVSKSNALTNVCNNVNRYRKFILENSKSFYIEQSQLPAPYFPYIVTKEMIDLSGGSEFLQKISDQQKDAIYKMEGSIFIPKNGVNVEDVGSGGYREDFTSLLINKAKADGYRLTIEETPLKYLKDNNRLLYYLADILDCFDINEEVLDEIKASVEKTITKEEAFGAVTEVLNNRFKWFDFSSVPFYSYKRFNRPIDSIISSMSEMFMAEDLLQKYHKCGDQGRVWVYRWDVSSISSALLQNGWRKGQNDGYEISPADLMDFVRNFPELWKKFASRAVFFEI